MERTLRVHALFRMPELVGTVPGLAGTTLDTGIARVDRHAPVEVVSEYHDTRELRLIRWGVTLRRRSGGSHEGWRLTLPGDGDQEVPAEQMDLPLAASAPGRVPPEMADVVTALVRRSPLVAVATLHTQRTAHLLHSADGTTVAELVDDVVSIMDGDVVARRFRELRITPLTEDAATIDPVIDLLTAHGAMPGASSTAISALGPAAKAPPDVLPSFPVSPRDPSGDAV